MITRLILSLGVLISTSAFSECVVWPAQIVNSENGEKLVSMNSLEGNRLFKKALKKSGIRVSYDAKAHADAAIWRFNSYTKTEMIKTSNPYNPAIETDVGHILYYVHVNGKGQVKLDNPTPEDFKNALLSLGCNP